VDLLILYGLLDVDLHWLKIRVASPVHYTFHVTSLP